MTESTYLLDSFVSTSPGEPFRLFPFGTIVKNGKKRHVTPELARRFKLPHFQPPVKLGSHKEDAPAGGHMIRLEVRETGNPSIDGLWVYPEYTERGATAVREGHYKYESPEVFWEGDVFENPQTGEVIQGPLVVGAALLHMPHLGDAAALYSVEQFDGVGIRKENTMTDNISIPSSLYDRFMAFFDRGNQPPEPAPPQRREPEPAPDLEQFDALKSQLTEMQAQLKQSNDRAEELQAENARQTRLTSLSAVVANPELYGANFAGDASRTAAQHLDSMNEEAREWVLQSFRSMYAVAKQGAASLQSDIGAEGEPEGTRYETAAEEFNALVLRKMTESGGKLDYNAAANIARTERPDLALQAVKGGK